MNYYHLWKSSIGNLHIIVGDASLKVVAFDDNWGLFLKKYETSLETQMTDLHVLAMKQLTEYINGKREVFDIPLDPKGTDFQKDVWDGLTKIPYGEVRSYQEQAINIKKPKAVRAVGTANSKNPISIIIPCHRVIGKDGKLRGYAGGLGAKDMLLKIEGKLINNYKS